MSLNWNVMSREERIEALRPMRQAGYTRRHMAAYLGTSRSTISGYVERYLKDVIPDRRGARQNPVSIVQNRSRDLAGRGRAKRAPRLREIPVAAPKRFAERRMDFECAWIVGEARGADIQCCGARTELGASWCRAHRDIVFGSAKKGGC